MNQKQSDRLRVLLGDSISPGDASFVNMTRADVFEVVSIIADACGHPLLPEKPPDVPFKKGGRYVRVSSDQEFILACVKCDMYALIGLHDGNRWNEPACELVVQTQLNKGFVLKE